jgi:hypothetical protein
MSDIPPVSYDNMQDALASTMNTSQAVAEGIANHAQRHEIALDERRRAATANRRLAAAQVARQ